MVESSGHRRHDRLAVAASIDAGMTLPAWLVACLSCAMLRTDLLAIRSSVPAAALPSRTRDYRLTRADAARLRQRTWHRFVGAIGGARDAVTRPLAASLTAVGLAGLLIGALPAGIDLGMFGAAGAAEAAPAADPMDHRVTTSGATETDAVAPVAGHVTASPGEDANLDAATLLSLLALTSGATLFGVRRLATRLGPVR